MIDWKALDRRWREQRMATPLAEEALKALANAVAENDGRPLTDYERAELAAKLRPGMSIRDASRKGGKKSHDDGGRSISDTEVLVAVLRISSRSLACARERLRGPRPRR